MHAAPRISMMAQSVLDRVNLLRNPYFTALADGSMSLPQFRASQEHFFFAVQYYARPMAALVSRIPEPECRLDLVHNLVEEHGDLKEEQFHANTFRRFLATIKGNVPQCPAPAVHAFNTMLMGCCLSEPVPTAICCMGIIEHAFAGVSALIARVVVERGWIPADKLVHYALHAELDVRHAEEFFAIVEPGLDESFGRRTIEIGLELGAYAFDQLYRSLLVHARCITA